MCLWPGYHLHHDTAKHVLLWCRESVNWRVEWNSVVFSDESRFSERWTYYASKLTVHEENMLKNVRTLLFPPSSYIARSCTGLLRCEAWRGEQSNTTLFKRFDRPTLSVRRPNEQFDNHVTSIPLYPSHIMTLELTHFPSSPAELTWAGTPDKLIFRTAFVHDT